MLIYNNVKWGREKGEELLDHVLQSLYIIKKKTKTTNQKNPTTRTQNKQLLKRK